MKRSLFAILLIPIIMYSQDFNTNLYYGDQLCEIAQGALKSNKSSLFPSSLHTNKDILLADEPISALDVNLSQIAVETMKKKFDTIVCSLHNVEVALNNFDRIIGLNDGTIVLDKKSSEITPLDTTMLYDVCK